MNGLYVSAEIFANENTRSILVEKPTPRDLIILFAGNGSLSIFSNLQIYLKVLNRGIHNMQPKNMASMDSE